MIDDLTKRGGCGPVTASTVALAIIAWQDQHPTEHGWNVRYIR